MSPTPTAPATTAPAAPGVPPAAAKARYVCIHGHFYQPPRENPWIEEVELQDSARPYHDWNARISAECYGPNSASRILDAEQRIVQIVNNYASMSFNFGPTLLSWLARHRPAEYAAILEADKLSAQRFAGHGSAIAQVYNHMIMPLASERDRRTQLLWGLEDFRTRFGRDPEGIWLPETAADVATLAQLADNGIRFTILAPRQAHEVRAPGAESFEDVSGAHIDPTRPYRCELPGGKEITLFFYDGPISQELAFGTMLDSGEAFRDKLLGAFANDRDWDQLVHIATDGETYGHHHAHGDMALSYCLKLLDDDPAVELINYGAYLEKHPPQAEVRIFDNSSWSCIHGVERWKADCGCNSGMHPGWNQAWRAPLRETMNWLRDQAAELYEAKAGELFQDPWGVRDRYIQVLLDRSPDNVDAFLEREAAHKLAGEEVVTALKLCELARYAQLIFTSCGWFFDEISGIETVQILQYAARTIQLMEELNGPDDSGLENELIQRLEQAPSNVLKDGADAYVRYAKPARVNLPRVAAHFGIASLFEEFPEEYDLGCYHISTKDYAYQDAGRASLASGQAEVANTITRATDRMHFAVLHTGDQNITCGVKSFDDPAQFQSVRDALADSFGRGDMMEMVRRIDHGFGGQLYSVWHLFRDEQHVVMHQIMAPAEEAAETAMRQIYESNITLMQFLNWLSMAPPLPFHQAASQSVNAEIKRLLVEEDPDTERLTKLFAESREFSLELEADTLGFLASGWITAAMTRIAENPGDEHLVDELIAILPLLYEHELPLRLWRAQNVCFELAVSGMDEVRRRAGRGAEHSGWEEKLRRLAELLNVRIA